MALADLLDAIPIVQNATERNSRFPAPQGGQRVQNLASGAIERWNGTWISDFFGSAIQMVNVKAAPYNAVGDGVADDTVAMQAAHASGSLVYYPAGTYKFSTLVGIQSGGIVGDGIGKTILSSTDTTGASLITFTGPSPGIASAAVNIPIFSRFTLLATAGKVTGAGIQIAPSVGETYYPYFESVRTLQIPIGLDILDASRVKILACNFVNYGVAGVQIANSNVPDSGDSVIMASIFENMATGGAGIIYKSSAGLKVVGNKFNVGTYGLWAQWTGAGSGDLIFSNNSVENMSVSGVYMGRVGASSFHNLSITGNEFSLCTNTIVAEASLLLTVLISGNIISMNVAGATTGITITSASGVLIEGNSFRGNGGTPTAIALTSCDLVDVGINNFLAMSTKVAYTTCTNLFDHNPYYGTQLLANATFTTAFALPAAVGVYEVFALLPGNAAAISGTARIVADGVGLLKTGGELTASLQITISGLSVQLWQNSGVPQTLNWGYRRIA